jgi:class 3 adenylate cyclase/tetratricopeptide (TPR) repeat protein
MEAGGARAAAESVARRETEVLLPYVPRLVADWAATRSSELWRPIEATMVFADLSGFTAMSERLSRLGRQGAEEVTDAIGGCFAELLAVAYGAGGGLLKFGGDALLLAFTGEDHAVRAVWSAAAMRERLRTAGKLKTSAGNVTLRMSVGVHTDTFDFFLIGSPSRELLVTGAAASEVVAMEHDASAGQIVISPNTAAALPAACVGAPLGPGFLLRRSPERTDLDVDQFDETYDIDLRGYIPTATAEHVLAGGGAPEHRVVTVAFVHFEGLDQRLADHGPAHTAAALEELVTTVATACAIYDVALLATDVDADGGKFVLTAGAPSVRGHDEERMLATVRRIADAGTTIPVRIGVNRGAVFAGDVGPPYRRTYTVMGDTVNLAARLMAAAAPGRIVAVASVLDRAPVFETTALPPMKVKGKRAPIDAFEVGSTSAFRRATEGTDGADLPFVGRAGELAQLDALLQHARDGRGAAIQIVGPAGIGKTRLLAEARARTPELRWVRIICEAYEAATPYAAVWQLLHEALDIATEASPDDKTRALDSAILRFAPELDQWMPLIGSVLDLDIPETPETAELAPQYRAARVAAASATLLAAAFAGPTLLMIDDSEWIDEASREVVDVLRTLVAEAAIVLVLVVRDDTPPDDDTIVVGPLARDDVEAALHQATEHAPLRPHRLAELATRADGNPLFLTELWRAATDSGVGDADALPDSVEALVTAQLDRLPPALRTILGYASVLGRGFERSELQALADEDVGISDMTWSALSEFIQLDGADHARFRHGLLRDAAYGKLPFRRRRELHERAGRAIEERLGSRRDTDAELLSLHFFHAEAYMDAWRYGCIAAERARTKYANVDAAVLYTRALAAARKLPELEAADVAAVREALGEVHDRNGEYQLALADFRAARRLLKGDPVREAELLLKEAWIPERIGRYSDAVRTVRKGLQLVDGVEGKRAGQVRAQLAAWYAAVRQGQGRSTEAIEWAERAIADAIPSGAIEPHAHALYLLDWAYTDLGELDKATNFAKASELYAELGDLCGQGMVWNLQGACAYWRGDWHDALARYEESRAAYDRAGSALDAARSDANIAEVLSDQGRFDDAERHMRDALRVSTAAGYHYDIALIVGFLGRNCARAGRFTDAFLFLNASREEYANAGLHADVERIDAWLAETLQLSGDSAGALELADATLRTARSEGVSPEVPLLERVRAEALWSLGRLDDAAAALHASIEAARARSAEYELALATDVLVRVPELRPYFDDVDALIAEGQAVFERLGVVVVTL